MGHSTSWIALRGLNRAEIAARLDCVDTDIAPDRRTELALGRAASGWWIVWCRRFDYPTPRRLSALSQQAELVACQIEEHVMVSAAFAFRDGVQIWSVNHDPGEGVNSLAVEGEPPPELETIRARLAADQEAEGGEAAEVDHLFDAAPELVQAVSGYRYDVDEHEPMVFTQLRPIRRGFLQSLFGMR